MNKEKLISDVFTMVFCVASGMSAIVGAVGFLYYSDVLMTLPNNFVLSLGYLLFGLLGLLFYFVVTSRKKVIPLHKEGVV